MSEPCRHENGDEIKSFVLTIKALVKVEAERDAALAKLARVALLVRPLGILYAALPAGLFADHCKRVLDDLRAALEVTS